MFSEQNAAFALHRINSLVFITEAESVYSAVRTGSLYKTQLFFVFKGLNMRCTYDINWMLHNHETDRVIVDLQHADCV